MKTLQECKDEVAKKYQFFDWLNLEKRFARSVDTVDNLISVYYDEAAELYASQFNKPPVYGQTAEELTGDEINALRSVGIIAENWYAVSYNSNSMPYAIFQNEDYAKAYRDRFSATSIVDPWPMKIKDYRKKALPPSPGSVDVEEKKECQHEALTDTGVGYHHCPTCNASFKVDGLGDSSESEKQEHFVLKDDGKLYWIEKMPEFPAALNQFDPHDMSHYQNIILKSAIDNAVEVSNQEELCNTLLNKYEPEILVEAGKLYSLQCSVVRTVKWKQGKSYMPYEVPVAVVAFSKDLSREGELKDNEQ